MTLSTCEIEYINQIQIIKKIIWLSQLLKKLKNFCILQQSRSFQTRVLVNHSTSFLYCLITIIYCDNQKTITFAKNFENYSRIKYIEIQQHFVREKIVEKHIQLQYVLIDEQIVDELTKSFVRDKFEVFRKVLNLR